MGYCAYGGGDFHIKKEIPKQIFDKYNSMFEELYESGGCLSVTFSDRYHDEDFTEFMNDILPYCDSGEICLTGDDDCRWKFTIRNGAWQEINGKFIFDDELVSFDFGNKEEFVGQIVDCVQDAIDEVSSIKLEISGELYKRMSEKIKRTLENWNVCS